MASIHMLCPNTGVDVATGQHARPEEFASAAAIGGRFRCSACQRVHEWSKGDVRLADWPGATSTN